MIELFLLTPLAPLLVEMWREEQRTSRKYKIREAEREADMAAIQRIIHKERRNELNK